MLDGFVMAFSPWAIENLRFDETLGQPLHGYDFDICMQARAAGKKVITADFRVIHHHSLELISEVEGWIEAHMRLAEKWQDQILRPQGGEIDWKRRARRAEAEREAARAFASVGRGQGRRSQPGELQRELDGDERSTSWRAHRPARDAFLAPSGAITEGRAASSPPRVSPVLASPSARTR